MPTASVVSLRNPALQQWHLINVFITIYLFENKGPESASNMPTKVDPKNTLQIQTNQQ